LYAYDNYAAHILFFYSFTSSKQIHRIYRSTGASFAKAQQEFTTEFLRNEHVQNAATNAAAATIRAQMSSSRY
jgi:hypothetical protein